MILIYRKEILAMSHLKSTLSILYHYHTCTRETLTERQFMVSDRILYRNIINVVDHRGVCYLGVELHIKCSIIIRFLSSFAIFNFFCDMMGEVCYINLER